MGAPISGLQPAEQTTAEALLDSFKTISASERRKHATVFNYWLSIRGDRDFAPIRDLDPLELSDAAPSSVLLELVDGGEDAEIRHVGDLLKSGVEASRLSEAPSPSLLSCIAGKLPIIAISRNVLAFEDEFESESGPARCSVTLLPFSSTGTWVDYVYAFVTLEAAPNQAEASPEAPTDELTEESVTTEPAVAETEPEPEPAAEVVPVPPEEMAIEIAIPPEPEPEVEIAEEKEPAAASGQPGFSSKVFDAIAGVQGFFGTVVSSEPKEGKEAAAEKPADETASAVVEEAEEPEPAALAEEAAVVNEPVEQPAPAAEPEVPVEPETPAAAESQPKPSHSKTEGPLHSKLTEVRSKADEARMAKLRANAALYEGLSAAYDFALDAEEHPEEYLKLVGEQGLKIQLRAPMAPVVRLAFDGLCDDSMIAQLESVLVWALQNELPRGSLAERIESAGGIGPILNGQAEAA